jgi:CheY-like chemotaxis protein
MAKLVVITKGMPASSHELGANWTTIGRAHGNTFQIVENSISGRHCEVRVKNDELVVRDLLSTNGTFVGGKKVTEAILKADETFRVGEVELRFEASADLPATSFKSKMLVTRAADSAKKISEPQKSVAEEKPIVQPTTGEPAKKHHALFVDDSLAFLETFSELCSVLANNTWEIHSATTADAALAILQENPVDLVVLDIGIPMVDGIQLLGIIARRYPAVKIAVMTGNASESNRAACLSAGAELFIEKPVSADGIKIVFNMLNDLISWHREGFTGALRHVGLQEVIQIECNGRHSSILEIRNPQLRGQIFIETGAIIHAAIETLVGEQAFYRLLSLKGGEFQLKPFQSPPQRTIHGQWESLLMEAAHVCDEETAFVTKSSEPKPSSAEKTSPTAETDHALGEDIVVVATYDGKWNPADGEKK